MTAAEKTQNDLDELLAIWSRATPAAKRIFGEAALCVDGHPVAQEITEAAAMDSKWSKK